MICVLTDLDQILIKIVKLNKNDHDLMKDFF